ncbi:glycosyltransferase family 2 protein [Vibrio splendidus]|uniref:glycosyltransferase family 2 protein n=1 Tax=Vibrio splendidus TaxID=29497 RepID=UPI00076A6B98|nr:glycosyltransferase [Vibrio splendidus]
MIEDNNGKLFLEVAVSTLNDGLYKISFSSQFDYLVVHQITDGDGNDYDEYITSFPSNVRYVRSYSRGLSKSRNIALSNTKAKYLWIMDDDVTILSQSKGIVFDILSKYPDCGLYIVSHSDDEKSFTSEYKVNSIGLLKSFKVASIDMIIDVETLDGINFDEMFGLGSEYPSGEEFIFTNQVLKRGFSVLKFSIVASIHPLEASGLDYYSTPNKLRAKLLMLIKVLGPIKGTVLYLTFLVRKMPELIRARALKNVLKSFFGRLC